MYDWKENDWELLLAKVRSKQVIPIIGKDLITVSAPVNPGLPGVPGSDSTIPLHDWISQRLLEKYGSYLNNSCYLESLANKIIKTERSLYPEDLKIVVAKLLEGSRDDIDTANFDKLARITDFKLFINTTFTPYISEKLKDINGENPESGFAVHEINYLPNSPIQNLRSLPLAKKKAVSINDLAKRCILNLFGDHEKDPTNYLLTDNEVVDLMIFLLTDDEWKNSALFDLISSPNSHFLFLGCSFPDWLFKFFVRVFSPDWISFESTSKNKYLSDHLVNLDTSRATFLSNNKVKVHPYTNVSDFVDELYRRWDNQPGPPTTEVRDQIVFISFANEDRDLVRIICKIFGQYGIDYWLDEQKLRYGDNIRPELKVNIAKACVFVPIITRHSLLDRDRGDFLLEWDYADSLLNNYQASNAPSEQTLTISPIVINLRAYNPIPQQAFGNVRNSFWNKRQMIVSEEELRKTDDFTLLSEIDGYMKQIRDRQRKCRSAFSIKHASNTV